MGDAHVRESETSTSDSINAKLSDSEFIAKASSVKKIGIENMEYMNRTVELPIKRADGGLVLRVVLIILDGHCRCD